MGRISVIILGAVVGAVTSFVVNYLFGPATGTTFDKSYQSRLDKALAEGKLAAEEHEMELRRQLSAAKGQMGE